MVLNLALWYVQIELDLLLYAQVARILQRVWTAIVTKQLEDEQPVIDWTSGTLFGKTFILFVLFGLATMATQTSLYWIISQSMSRLFTFCHFST